MIKYILWDVDDTLINFGTAMDKAMYDGFRDFGLIELTPEGLNLYKQLNDKYWKNLENGTMDRDTILHGRFAELFDNLGVKYDDKLLRDFNIYHQLALGKVIDYMPHAEEVLDDLGKKYKQYGITNGSKIAQDGKLDGSGLRHKLDGTFISEELGHDKPSAKFFDIVFEEIGSFERDDYIIIGDSLTSDIRGSNNVGVKNIWYNPYGKVNNVDVQVDYVVDSLKQIPAIIKDINNGQ